MRIEIDPNAGEGPGILVQQHELMGAVLSGIGGGVSPIDPLGSTAEFVEQYGLTIDGEVFDLEHRYKHLRELYEDTRRLKVAMAGAQTGKSAWVMANLARDMAGRAWGSMLGYYFPDIHLPKAFSHRFKPFLRSNPRLAELLGARQAGRGNKGVDNVLTMSWGECIVFFMTIGGRTATEGLPLPCVYFDEVRRMSLGDIERAMERYSAQENPVDIKVSTARYPETDIHHWFLKGDQRYFHTACGCPEGIVLSLTFPDCIADLRRASPNVLRKAAHAFSHAGLPELGMTDEQREEFPAAVYMCPKCAEIIVDPRMGWWEPHRPDAFVHSYQMPQLLSWTFPAGRMLQKYEQAVDQQEFYNSGLGLPFVDLNKMPVQLDHLWACVDNDIAWGEHMSDSERRRRFPNCAMGVDVQAGYLIAVVKHAMPSGKHRTVHVEVVEHESNPWIRLGHLMQRYDVRMCVLDYAPEFTSAMNFAKTFRGRVYLQQYTLGDSSERMVAWGEDALGADRKQKGDTSFRYWVAMQRTRILHWGCMRWVNRANVVPDPRQLIQRLPIQDSKVILTAHLRIGMRVPTAIGLDPYFDHQTRFVFRDEIEDDTSKEGVAKLRKGKTKQIAEWVGKDPHFAHADTWASVALSRIGGRHQPRRP